MDNKNTVQTTEGDDANKWGALEGIPFAGALDGANVSTLELSSTDSIGDKVNAFEVHATDSEGNAIKTSNIIESRAAEVQLGGGEYISEVELSKALSEYISTQGGDDVSCVRIEPRKEYSDRAAAIRDCILDASRGANLRLAPEPKIPAQDARQVFVGNADNEIKSSDLFLGKDKIELPNGEYLPMESVQRALENYIMADETMVVTTAAPNSAVQNESLSNQGLEVKGVKKGVGKKIATAILAGVLAASVIFGANHEANVSGYDPVLQPTPAPIELVSNGNIDIGDVYDIHDVEVHSTSDYEGGGANATGQIGGNILQNGNYTVQSFSITDPNTHEIKSVTWQDNMNLNDFLQQTANQYGVSVNDLDTKIHLGNENGAAGWIDLNDFLQSINNNNQ